MELQEIVHGSNESTFEKFSYIHEKLGAAQDF